MIYFHLVMVANAALRSVNMFLSNESY